jgi:1,4-dihydroxy-2-naphthoyl-CoA hydrolase
MSIWKRDINIDELNRDRGGTMLDTIGIEFTGYTDDTLSARMPVDSRTHQPYGILHGGASATLAETLGSMAAVFVVKDQKVVGIELNINHLAQVTEGWVTGVVSAVRVGRRIQVWDIRIADERGRLISVSRLTTMAV